jgi:hypothetical protein
MASLRGSSPTNPKFRDGLKDGADHIGIEGGCGM